MLRSILSFVIYKRDPICERDPVCDLYDCWSKISLLSPYRNFSFRLIAFSWTLSWDEGNYLQTFYESAQEFVKVLRKFCSVINDMSFMFDH